jgi:hypothetical protein
MSMGRLPRFPKSSALAALVLAIPAWGLEVPAGTELQIRLKSKVSTQDARVKDPVEAVVIAPVPVGGQFAIPGGAAVRGTVVKTTASTKPDERAALALSFSEIEIDGKKLKLAAALAAIDNAREKLDDQGQINGILASETITGRLDSGISRVTDRYSGFGGFLNTVKSAVLKPADCNITYDVGTEMTLKLTSALSVAKASTSGPESKVEAIADEAALVEMVSEEPFQTVAENPPKPSDITNIMLIGTEEQVKAAFTDALWHIASSLNTMAKFETFRALAEDRGYHEAPVSVLLLDGKPPEFVFEKLNNTFEQRHHLRVWRRPATFGGQTVWAVAATHDTGISFSEANRTFIHKIDSQIDRERAKVVNDLIFAGHVQSLALVERAQVPQHGQNATGDNLETDAKIAVLALQ